MINKEKMKSKILKKSSETKKKIEVKKEPLKKEVEKNTNVKKIEGNIEEVKAEEPEISKKVEIEKKNVMKIKTFEWTENKMFPYRGGRGSIF